MLIPSPFSFWIILEVGQFEIRNLTFFELSDLQDAIRYKYTGDIIIHNFVNR